MDALALLGNTGALLAGGACLLWGGRRWPLLVVFGVLWEAYGAEPALPCHASGRVDLFIMLDVSPSMSDRGKEHLLPECVRFIESKVAEIQQGTVNLTCFAQTVVNNSTLPAIEAKVDAADLESLAGLLRRINPEKYGRAEQPKSWKGLLAAIEAYHAREAKGTDIGGAMAHAVAILEKRAQDTNYLARTLGQQLWVLTDSEEKSTDRLNEMLDRMKALKSRLWFDYREIAFLPTNRLPQEVRTRHERIREAGFNVDYTTNLAQRIRVPWPLGSAGGTTLAGDMTLGCAIESYYAVKLEPPVILDACGGGSRRASGDFRLEWKPVPSGSDGVLAEIYPNIIKADDFGKQTNLTLKLKIANPVQLPSTPASAVVAGTLVYRYEEEAQKASISTAGKKGKSSAWADTSLVDYLGPQELPVQVSVSRPAAWQIGIQGADRPLPEGTVPLIRRENLLPGDEVASLQMVAAGDMPAIPVTLSLACQPAGMITFQDGRSELTVTVGGSSGSQKFKLLLATNATGRITGTLTATPTEQGLCSVKVSPKSIQFDVTVVDTAKLYWLAADGSRMPVPKHLEISAKECPTFCADDIRDLPAFVTRLTHGSDDLAQSLIGRFSASTKRALADYEEARSEKAPLLKSLAAEFGKIVNEKLLYDPLLFTGRKLSAQTQELLEKQPKGEELARLNRLLLENAYPEELRNHARGWALHPTGTNASEAFLLELPRSLTQSPVRVEFTPEPTNYLKYAAWLTDEDCVPGQTNRWSLAISRKGAQAVWMDLRPDAGPRTYAGKLKITPSPGMLLNGSSNAIAVEVEVHVPPPPEGNQTGN